MAKYEIQYACGHTAIEQLYGPEKDRERKIIWYGTKNCADCLAKERADVAAHMAEHDREVLGLADLSGTEKQIVWATQIRHQAFADAAKIEADLTLHASDDNPRVAALAEQAIFELDAIIEDWKRATSAYWWIEHKAEVEYARVKITLNDMIRELADAMRDLVVSDIGLSPAEPATYSKSRIQQRKQQLQDRRDEEAAKRAGAANAERLAKEQAAKAERDKLAAQWVKKDRLAEAVHAAIGSRSATISTYYKGAEKRIYLDSGKNKACLYVTGNSRNRPGSIDAAYGVAFACDQALLRAALEMCAADWKNVRVDITADGKAGK